MVDMLFYTAFDTKLVDDEAQGDGTCVVPPQNGIQTSWVIATWFNGFLLLFIGKVTCPVQPINESAALNVHVAGMCPVHQNVLVGEFLWDQTEEDADVLVIFGYSIFPPRQHFKCSQS